jgi:hypothetical protein
MLIGFEKEQQEKCHGSLAGIGIYLAVIEVLS